MSSKQPSDEVAEDYKLALQDLISNDVYSIHNLTVVAKDYTEYAPAISKTLEEHIRKVSYRYDVACLDSVEIQIAYYGRVLLLSFERSSNQVSRLRLIVSSLPYTSLIL